MSFQALLGVSAHLPAYYAPYFISFETNLVVTAKKMTSPQDSSLSERQLQN